MIPFGSFTAQFLKEKLPQSFKRYHYLLSPVDLVSLNASQVDGGPLSTVDLRHWGEARAPAGVVRKPNTENHK